MSQAAGSERLLEVERLEVGAADVVNDPLTGKPFPNNIIPRERFSTARQLVEASLAEARQSVWDLRPQYLDRRDLVSALQRMTADLGENTDVRIGIAASGAVRALSTDVERNVFRIVQEAVANAIRHALARHIRIEARFDQERAEFVVIDDGRGFDANIPSMGFGLTSMRERAEQIGAALCVKSQPGAGTSVSITIPVQPLERRASVRCAVARWFPR